MLFWGDGSIPGRVASRVRADCAIETLLVHPRLMLPAPSPCPRTRAPSCLSVAGLGCLLPVLVLHMIPPLVLQGNAVLLRMAPPKTLVVSVPGVCHEDSACCVPPKEAVL